MIFHTKLINLVGFLSPFSFLYCYLNLLSRRGFQPLADSVPQVSFIVLF